MVISLGKVPKKKSVLISCEGQTVEQLRRRKKTSAPPRATIERLYLGGTLEKSALIVLLLLRISFGFRLMTKRIAFQTPTLYSRLDDIGMLLYENQNAVQCP